MIAFEVLGTPAPKGSNRAMLIGGKARFVPGGSGVNRTKQISWDVAVRDAAREAVGDVAAPPFVQRALRVEITFLLARPSGHWRANGNGLKPSAPIAPSTKPDVDKLARQALDSLNALAFDDDSRIVELVVRKRYAEPGHEGARFEIAEWSP